MVGLEEVLLVQVACLLEVDVEGFNVVEVEEDDGGGGNIACRKILGGVPIGSVFTGLGVSETGCI